MSKKKSGKKAATRRSKKKAPASKASKRKGAAARALAPAPLKGTSAATIFIYKTAGGYRIRTSPQLLGAMPGYVEWTVVDMTSDDPVEVEISWPDGGPWGADPIKLKGNARKSLADAKGGRYKYSVTAYGFTEDPELEYPVA